MDSDRRDFLRAAAMAAASASAVNHQANETHALELEANAQGIQWNKAPCRFCGTGCHVQVGVDQGRVVAIAGDRAADVNKGLLCVKGYHAGGILYGKDRLTSPLLRQGDRFVNITWDQAIDIVAKRILLVHLVPFERLLLVE